eukprot:RCo038499
MRRRAVAREAAVAAVIQHWTREEEHLRTERENLAPGDLRKRYERRSGERLRELQQPDEIKRVVVKEVYFQERAAFLKLEKAHQEKLLELKNRFLSLKEFAKGHQAHPRGSPRSDGSFAKPRMGAGTSSGNDVGLVKEVLRAKAAYKAALKKTPQFNFSPETIPLSRLLTTWREMFSSSSSIIIAAPHSAASSPGSSSCPHLTTTPRAPVLGLSPRTVPTGIPLRGESPRSDPILDGTTRTQSCSFPVLGSEGGDEEDAPSPTALRLAIPHLPWRSIGAQGTTTTTLPSARATSRPTSRASARHQHSLS